MSFKILFTFHNRDDQSGGYDPQEDKVCPKISDHEAVNVINSSRAT